jgi:hypothetical protein
MKNLLSFWSGRLLSLLFSALVAACFLLPTSALARMDMSNGNGGGHGTEGDPLDNNDYGGGSGGGSNVHDQNGGGPVTIPIIIDRHDIMILLVPEFVGGVLNFRILVVPLAEPGHAEMSLEGTHAP